MKAHIDIENLRKEFERETGRLLVLNNLNLNVKVGSIATIEGASGSGKSTLLNIIGTLDTPTSGKLQYGACSLHEMTDKEKEKFRAQKLGFVFQHHYLLPNFTVLENTMMPLLICRKNWQQARQESKTLLGMVGLQNHLDHYPSQISGGETARAGVARALVGQKSLLLADEPTGNLDRKNSDRLAGLLWDLHTELGFSLIIVTHDRDLASRVEIRYKLNFGKLERVT